MDIMEKPTQDIIAKYLLLGKSIEPSCYYCRHYGGYSDMCSIHRVEVKHYNCCDKYKED